MKEKKRRERFSPAENARICAMIKQKAMEEGLFGMFTNPIPIVPPLVITKDEIDQIVGTFEKIIVQIAKAL